MAPNHLPDCDPNVIACLAQIALGTKQHGAHLEMQVLKPVRNGKGYSSQANKQKRKHHLTRPLGMLPESWQQKSCKFFCRYTHACT